MYHYLTGAASWYLLTVVTRMFGVRGEKGQLCLAPNLRKEQFDAQGNASISLMFQGKKINVQYKNASKLENGEYVIKEVTIDGLVVANPNTDCYVVSTDAMAKLDVNNLHELVVVLG